MTTIGFDVDGTLIDYEGKQRYDIINLLMSLSALNHTKIIVASGGGYDYANQIVNKLGLCGYVDIITNKTDLLDIDIWFDDQETTIGKVDVQI